MVMEPFEQEARVLFGKDVIDNIVEPPSKRICTSENISVAAASFSSSHQLPQISVSYSIEEPNIIDSEDPFSEYMNREMFFYNNQAESNEEEE